MICWARFLLLICAYGYKDVKSGSDLHWFPLPWKPLSYYSWTKEGGQEVGGFEKRLQIYLYCWMSRTTLPSFWLKNYTLGIITNIFPSFWVLRHCWAGLGPLRSLWCLAKTTSGEWYPTCSLLDGRWRYSGNQDWIRLLFQKTNGWNLKVAYLKRKIIIQTSIFGFHVSFWECICFYRTHFPVQNSMS